MFEFLLMEFYDNHMSLSTNNNKSYRLSAPIYVTYKKNKITISNVWQSQIEKLSYTIIDAEVSKYGLKLETFIERNNWVALKYNKL